MLVEFDRRGFGLSDRDVTVESMDELILDIEAVIADLELDRFSLWGTSQSAALAIQYAATHAGRVERLVLHGGYAEGSVLRLMGDHTNAAVLAMIRTNWGLASRAMAEMALPAEYDAEATERLAERQRSTASSEAMAANWLLGMQLDVREWLPHVDVPTLVTHATGDSTVPFANGQSLAASIRGATFLPFESPLHQPTADGYGDAWIDAVEDFLGSDADAAPDRAEPGRSTYPDALSEREVEVLGLVAAGMTNAEIAAQLVIAPATAARHVSNILNKIGLSNRTQAASYATKHGLDRG
jgi:pimeloyl-ACP methyl ester carboxylesterase/DNA-binding CsgD family transcriptional regulator